MTNQFICILKFVHSRRIFAPEHCKKMQSKNFFPFPQQLFAFRFTFEMTSLESQGMHKILDK